MRAYYRNPAPIVSHHIHMKTHWTLLLTLGISVANAAPLPATQRETFDFGWKHARFGNMPDGTVQPEPGAESAPLTSSSHEHQNIAMNAMDGNRNTRWCAANANPGHYITADFGKPVAVSQINVIWEKAAPRDYVISGSDNGKTWTDIAARIGDNGTESAQNLYGKNQKPADSRAYRYYKFTVNGTGGGNWASIREIEFTDAAGKKIKPAGEKLNANKVPFGTNFDDTKWRSLNLPHDWAIEGPFRPELENETGKLPWVGIGWYRKSFDVPADAGEHRYYLDFDGVLSMPKVYVNGELAGEWGYGYSSFRVDISKHLKPGQKNTVAVRAENLPRSSRWYPGAGIYRHVWLTKTNPVHVDNWGVSITTPQVSKDKATVEIKTTVLNTSDKPATVSVENAVAGVAGAAGKPETVTIPAGQSKEITSTIQLGNPKLWDLDTPHLYDLATTIKLDGKIIDKVNNTFGVRTVEWKPDGFYLNGRKVRINGVCQHHDLGPLGAAVYARGYERQLEILKEMGVNSIRTSHNPPAPELLEACDRMGILVDNELFDIWEHQKYDKANGYHILWKDWHVKDLQNFVKRDRNHPSVICWSAGNEIDEQGTARGKEVAQELVRLFHEADPSRKVTVGCNNPNAWKNGFGEIFDIYGFNYKPHLYGEFIKQRPNQPVIASETSSCVSTRGEYYFPVKWGIGDGFFNYQVSSYDLYAPGWAYRPDREFAAQDANPNIAGEYVWTGFDYLGEPTPYNQDRANAGNFSNPEEAKAALERFAALGNKAPSRSSYFGIVDLCGFPKDRFFIYQAHWRPDLKMAHILPHWNWEGREGEITPVHVYSSGDTAELFLNGKSQGVRVKKPGSDTEGYRFFWNDVKYEPGELKVVVTKNGQPWATATRATTGKTAAIDLQADRTAIAGDARDISYVTVTMKDAKGNTVPTAKEPLTFTVNGPAEIIGVCNGNPVDLSGFQKNTIDAFNGLAQVIVRGKRGESGPVTLTATSPGIKTATIKLNIAKPTAEQLKK